MTAATPTVNQPTASRSPPAPALPASRIGRALLDRLRSAVTLTSGEHEEIEVRIPFTGGVLGQIPHGTPADIEEAVRRARAAQPD